MMPIPCDSFLQMEGVVDNKIAHAVFSETMATNHTGGADWESEAEVALSSAKECAFKININGVVNNSWFHIVYMDNGWW